MLAKPRKLITCKTFLIVYQIIKSFQNYLSFWIIADNHIKIFTVIFKIGNSNEYNSNDDCLKVCTRMLRILVLVYSK